MERRVKKKAQVVFRRLLIIYIYNLIYFRTIHKRIRFGVVGTIDFRAAAAVGR